MFVRELRHLLQGKIRISRPALGLREGMGWWRGVDEQPSAHAPVGRFSVKDAHVVELANRVLQDARHGAHDNVVLDGPSDAAPVTNAAGM